MPSNTPPPLFSAKARLAKRQRAVTSVSDADFLYHRAADDIVDRLETILKRFDQALLTGPGTQAVIDALTPAADVGACTLHDTASHPKPCGSLPFEDGAFDLAVSSMNLHAATDLPHMLTEFRRVVKPDGVFIATFAGAETLRELRTVLQMAETETTGRVAPRIYPFVAIKDAGGLMQRAGFALPVADVDSVAISYKTLSSLFTDLRAVGETNALERAPRGAFRRDTLGRAAALYQEHFPYEGGILATVDLVTLTGWSPHASQPKPLKPGSAQASMADAIRSQMKDRPKDD